MTPIKPGIQMEVEQKGPFESFDEYSIYHLQDIYSTGPRDSHPISYCERAIENTYRPEI